MTNARAISVTGIAITSTEDASSDAKEFKPSTHPSTDSKDAKNNLVSTLNFNDVQPSPRKSRTSEEDDPPIPIRTLLKDSARSYDSTSEPNKFVGQVTYASARWAQIGQVLTALFMRKWIARATVDTLSAFDIDHLPLPDNYGDFFALAPFKLELFTDVLALATILYGVTSFDPKALSEKYALELRGGFLYHLEEFLADIQNHKLLLLISPLILTEMIGLSWREIEPIFEQLQSWGDWKYLPITLLLSANLLFLFFLSGKDAKRGLDYLFNRYPAALHPPQKYAWQHIYEGRWATTLEIFLESQTEHATAAFLGVFLIDLIRERLLPASLTLACRIVGGISGYTLSCLTRPPKVYKRYHGTLRHRLDLVDEAKQKMLSDSKSKKVDSAGNYFDVLKRELKSLLFGGQESLGAESLLGYSQVALTTYFAVLYWLDSSSALELILIGMISGVMRYIPFRLAQRELEVRSEALLDAETAQQVLNIEDLSIHKAEESINADKRKLEAELKPLEHPESVIQAVNPKNRLHTSHRSQPIITNNKQMVLQPDDQKQKKINTLQKKINQKKFELDQLAFRKTKVHEKTTEIDKLCPDDPLYVDESLLSRNPKKSPHANYQSTDQPDPSKKEVPDDAIKMNTFALPPKTNTASDWLASFITAGSNVANTLLGISSFLVALKDTVIGKTHVIALATSANCSKAVTDFNYMQPKSAETLRGKPSESTESPDRKPGCGERFLRLVGLFGSNNRDTDLGIDDEKVSLTGSAPIRGLSNGSAKVDA